METLTEAERLERLKAEEERLAKALDPLKKKVPLKPVSTEPVKEEKKPQQSPRGVSTPSSTPASKPSPAVSKPSTVSSAPASKAVPSISSSTSQPKLAAVSRTEPAKTAAPVSKPTVPSISSTSQPKATVVSPRAVEPTKATVPRDADQIQREIDDRERKTREERALIEAEETKRREEDDKRRVKEEEERKKRLDAQNAEFNQHKQEEERRRTSATEQVITCAMTQEAKDELAKIRAQTDDQNSALILKCNPKTGEVELVDTKDNVTPEELSEEIPDGAPRFVFYRFIAQLDIKHRQNLLLLIYYNPLNLHVNTKMMYGSTKNALMESVKGAKLVEFSALEDFTDFKIHDQALGVNRRNKLQAA